MCLERWLKNESSYCMTHFFRSCAKIQTMDNAGDENGSGRFGKSISHESMCEIVSAMQMDVFLIQNSAILMYLPY